MIDPRSILLNPALVGLFGLMLTGIGALIGYAIRYQLDKRKELISEVNRERREVYHDTVALLVGMLESTKKRVPLDTNKIVSDLYRIYSKKVLYASPEVLDAFNNFMEQAQQSGANKPVDPYAIMYGMSDLMAAMRTDLGLSNKGMGKHSRRLLRAVITDIDKQP